MGRSSLSDGTVRSLGQAWAVNDRNPIGRWPAFLISDVFFSFSSLLMKVAGHARYEPWNAERAAKSSRLIRASGGRRAADPACAAGDVRLRAGSRRAADRRGAEPLPRRGPRRRHLLSRLPQRAAGPACAEALPRRGLPGGAAAMRSPRAPRHKLGVEMGETTRRRPRDARAGLLPRALRLRARRACSTASRVRPARRSAKLDALRRGGASA